MVLCTCCKDCTKRHMRCHSTCLDYLDFRRNKDIENKQIREYLNVDSEMIEYRNKVHEKLSKRHK